MSGLNGRAATLLGQTNEVTLTGVELRPSLSILVTSRLGPYKFAEPMLAVIDPGTGKALVCPVTDQGRQTIASHLVQGLQQQVTTGGQDGSAAVYE